ncbi:hypothetical protein BKA69DRAFT_877926 [Paraphysoderma sedebokerense]|nr:hypothetical protein BKA69DRAFT_877926 [Paraphysoderma sedebokerense]
MESALPLFANHFAALNALRERNLNLFAEKCLETKSLLSNLHAKYSSHNQQHAATPDPDPELEPQPEPEPEPVKSPPPKKRRGRPPKKGPAKANPKRKAKKQPSPVVPDPATNASHTSPEHFIPTTNLNETVENDINPSQQPEIVDEIKESDQNVSTLAPLNADSKDAPVPNTTETITAAEVVEPAPINEPRKIGERALRLPAVFSSNIFASIPQNFDPSNDSSIPSPPVPLKSRKQTTKSTTLGQSEPGSKDSVQPKASIPPKKAVSDTFSTTSAQSAGKDTKSAQPQSSNGSTINALDNKVPSSVQPSDSSLPVPSVAPSSSQATVENSTISLAKPTDILQVVQLTDKSNDIPSHSQSTIPNIPTHHSSIQPDSSAMQQSQLQSSTLTHFEHNSVPPTSTAPSIQSLDPVVQIDSHMIQQEQRLKTMFTSGAEKLKKALSSLRTVPAAPVQVPAPLPAAATIVRHLSTMNQTVSSSHANTGRKPSVEAPPEFVESVNSSQDIKVEVKAPSISKTKVEAAPEATKTLEIRRDSNLDGEHTKYQKNKRQSQPSERVFNNETLPEQSEPLNEIEVQDKKVHKAKTDVFTWNSTAIQESALKETDCQPSSKVSGSTTVFPSTPQVQDDYLSLPPEQRRTSYEKAKKIFEASIQPPPPPSNSTSTMPRSLPPTATSTSTPPKPKISSELTLQKPLLRSHIPTSISSPFKSTASPRLRKMDSPLKMGANLKAKNSKIVKVSKGSPMVSKFMEKNIESVRSSEVLDVRQSNSDENRFTKDQTVGINHHQELESLNVNDKAEVEESADLNDEMDDVMKIGELEVNEEFIGDVGMIENEEEIQDEHPMRSDSGKQLEEEQEPEMQTKLCKPSSLLSGVVSFHFCSFGL